MSKISYGVRNSIVLLVAFIGLSGGCWAYIQFAQNKLIDKLETKDQQDKVRMRKDQAIANRYEQTLHQYVAANYKLNHFPKTLSATLQTYDVYDFLNKASQGNAYTDLNFTYLNTVKTKNYGVVKARVNGTGYYRYVYNLIRTIEKSYPLVKIKSVVINPFIGKDKNNFSQVAFTFELESYFDKTGDFKHKNISVNHAGVSKVYNPFYPLIHNIPPNTNALPNVEKSKLVGVGSGLIYLIDQSGHVQKLDVGDPVYLGHLESVDLDNKTATFYLNKGGIFDKVTLEVH